MILSLFRTGWGGVGDKGVTVRKESSMPTSSCEVHSLHQRVIQNRNSLVIWLGDRNFLKALCFWRDYLPKQGWFPEKAYVITIFTFMAMAVFWLFVLKMNLSFSKREGWGDDLITIFKYVRDCYSIWKMTTSCSVSKEENKRKWICKVAGLRGNMLIMCCLNCGDVKY